MEVEGGRRRWLQVVVVLAVLVAGVVANRSNTERADEQRAFEERQRLEVPSAGPPAPLPQSLRTTDRLGPLLPEPTGTTLVLAAGTQVIVLDVDSGTLRSVQLADLKVDGGYPWGSPVLAVGDALVVRSRPPEARVIPRTDGQAVTELDVGSGGGLYPSTSEGAFWVEELRGEARLEEVDRSGVVRRSVVIPNNSGSIVWDGTGFIQTVDGEVLAFPADGGEPTPLGPGLAVAADAATVAVLHCRPAPMPGGNPCDLELLDRAAGTSRVVDPPEDVAGFRAGYDAGLVPALSPDGRWLLLGADVVTSGNVGLPATAPGLVVVDVGTGTVRAVEPGALGGLPVGAFSPDGRHLFLARPVSSVAAELAAVRLADGDRFALDVEVSARASFGLVLEAVPSVAADLGSGED